MNLTDNDLYLITNEGTILTLSTEGRGTNCIRPNNEEWSKQVIEMYKYMKNN